MKSFINRIISFVFLCVSGLNTMLDAAQSPPASGISSSMSSSLSSSLSSSMQPMGVNGGQRHGQRRKRQEQSQAEESLEQENIDPAPQRPRVTPDVKKLHIGQRNMIIICDDGKVAEDLKSPLNMLVTAIVQKAAACILIHEGLWNRFLQENLHISSPRLVAGLDLLFDPAGTVACSQLFNEDFWEMYKIPAVRGNENFYLLVPKLYRELIYGKGREIAATRATERSAITNVLSMFEAARVSLVTKKQGVENGLGILDASLRASLLAGFNNWQGGLQAFFSTLETANFLTNLKLILEQQRGMHDRTLNQITQVLMNAFEDDLDKGKRLSEYQSCIFSRETSRSIDFVQEKAPTLNMLDLAFGLKLSKLERIDHPLQVIPSGSANAMAPGEILQDMPAILGHIFVAQYDVNAEASDLLNTWNIFMYGHGLPTQFDASFVQKLETLKQMHPIASQSQFEAYTQARQALFAGNQGSIAKLPVYTFAEIFDFFKHLIKTNFIYLISCYAAAEHMALLRIISPVQNSVTVATSASTFSVSTTAFEKNILQRPTTDLLTNSIILSDCWLSPMTCNGRQYTRATSHNLNAFFLQLANPSLKLGANAHPDYYARVTNFASKFLKNGKVITDIRIPSVSVGGSKFSAVNLGDESIEVTDTLVADDESARGIDACGKKIIFVSTPKVTVPLVYDKEMRAIVPMIDTTKFGQQSVADFLLPKMFFFKEIKFNEPGQPATGEIVDFIIKRMNRKFGRDALWPRHTTVFIRKLTMGDVSVDNVCIMFKICGDGSEVENKLCAWFMDERSSVQSLLYTLNDKGVIINQTSSNAVQAMDGMPYESFFKQECLSVLGDDDFVGIFGGATLNCTKAEIAQRAQVIH